MLQHGEDVLVVEVVFGQDQDAQKLSVHLSHYCELLDDEGHGGKAQRSKGYFVINQQLQEALFKEVVAEVEDPQGLVMNPNEIGHLVQLNVHPVHLDIGQEGIVEGVQEHLALLAASLLVQKGNGQEESLKKGKTAEEGV